MESNETDFQDLIDGSFHKVIENIDELCEIIELHTPYAYQKTKDYMMLKKKLIEDVKALEFYYKGTINK